MVMNDVCDIRKMTGTDLSEVCRIETQNFSEPWSYQGFLDALSREDTEYLVCEYDREIAGYCGAYISWGEADIVNVSVDKKFQNKQIATQLLQKLFLRLKERDVKDLTLEVRQSNRPAIPLYEKLGFQSEGVRPGFYENPKEDALIMWRRGI